MQEQKTVISVVDGQGGKIGREIISRCKKALGDSITIIALGTNAAATSAMVKGGADCGATGENAILYNVRKSDIIMGALGIIMANSMHGELTAKMSEAIGESGALKILIPIERCNIRIAAPRLDTAMKSIDYAVSIVLQHVEALTGEPQKKLYMLTEG